MAANLAVVDCEFTDPSPLPSGWKGCDIYNSDPAGVAASAKIFLSGNTTNGTLLGHSAGSDAVTICSSAAEMGITLPTATVLSE